MKTQNTVDFPPGVVRPELKPMPARIARLPVHRGYPVPWFVAEVDGVPDFRVSSEYKRIYTHKQRLCWVCGEKLGAHLVFVLGPMCGITRTTSELPCHRECAIWSAKNCPFLNRPHMVRRDKNLPPEAKPASGLGIPRNPGVALLWLTKSYKRFPINQYEWLIEVGPPEEILWFAEGHKATHDQIAESIRSGLPILEETALLDGEEGVKSFRAKLNQFLTYAGIQL